MAAQSESPVEIGSLLAGKYRIERVLGRGGMGVVVVAMHDELDQRVAIKFLHQEALKDADWVTRFAREARAAARIKSEHAVKVYDVGKLETGAPYMVMEYLEGRDLQTILNERKSLPLPEAVDYLLQACEAIAEAHAAGIVHRDLKPANLFVTHRTDGSSCVKILDFGISKMTSLTGGGRDQTVTNTTAIVGSPLYMSPEQMRASKNVDRRTDIWSIGVILQELITGMPSFVANTTAELCALVLTAEPTPLRSTLGDAPAALEAVVTRCLSKSPEQRFANVAELATALEPFGTPAVKMSVERITRITAGSGAQARKPVDAEPAPVSIVPAGHTSANVSTLGQTELSDSGATRADPNMAALPQPTGAGTAAAWGSPSQAKPATRKSRTPLIVGASAAAAVVLVIGIALLSTRASAPSVVATPPPSVTADRSPAVGAVTPEQVTTTPSIAPVASGIETAVKPASTTITTVAPKSTHSTAAPPPSTTASVKKPHVAPVDTTGFGGRN